MNAIHGPKVGWRRVALVGFCLGIMAAEGCGSSDNVLTAGDGSSTATADGPPAGTANAQTAPAARKGQSSRREFEKEHAEK